MSDPISTKIPSDINQLLSRSIIYHALGVLFRHPFLIEKDSLGKEQILVWQKAVDNLDASGTKTLNNHFQQLTQRLNLIHQPQWRAEYENCFGFTAHGIVPIYELEYGEEHSHRQPQQLGDITAFYNAFGLRINDKTHERADHLTTECEFMYYLLFKEAYANGQGMLAEGDVCQEAAKRFLSEHLGRWLPSFTRRLLKHAQSEMMKQLAEFSFHFIAQEYQCLGIKAGTEDLPLRSLVEKDSFECADCSLKINTAG